MKRDDVTPRCAYKPVILRVLVDLEGKGQSAKVLQQVEMRMRQTLTPGDYEPRSPKETRAYWKYEAS